MRGVPSKGFPDKDRSPSGQAATSTCYWCGRVLVAVVLAHEHRVAFKKGHLTCGPCVHVRGLPRFRGGRSSADRSYQMRQRQLKERLWPASVT